MQKLDYVPSANCFFDEFLGTAVLIIVVFAVTDRHNGPPPPGLVPLVLFILILGIGNALGMQTGYAINPARDLSPRIAHALLPIPGKGSSDWGYSWIPVVAPIIGGILGALAFDLFYPG